MLSSDLAQPLGSVHHIIPFLKIFRDFFLSVGAGLNPSASAAWVLQNDPRAPVTFQRSSSSSSLRAGLVPDSYTSYSHTAPSSPFLSQSPSRSWILQDVFPGHFSQPWTTMLLWPINHATLFHFKCVNLVPAKHWIILGQETVISFVTPTPLRTKCIVTLKLRSW